MNKINDEQLVARFLAGEDEAFEQLVKRHLKPIYNFLYQLTRDYSALDDLSQETFIKVWKNIARFDQNRSFKAWIFSIARNTAYDFLKKKKSLPFSFFKNAEGNNKLDQISDGRPLPDKIAETKDLGKNLREKLKNIPTRYRTILLLHYKEEFSLNEIAKIINKPLNTVKSYHRRALLKLKDSVGI